MLFLKLIGLVCFTLIPLSTFAQQSSNEDQTNVSITIYNNNLGLVKDTRSIQLQSGTNELKFMDVAEKINATTVHIKSLTDPNKLKVLEQNYEYDLLNPSKLMEKYVGRTVHFITQDPETKLEKTTQAKLLSTNGGPVYQVDGQIMLKMPGRIVFPKIPENLIANPTLIWLLDSKKSGTQKIEASYLTDGIQWSADYVVVLNQQDSQGDLSGWVTINNNSGATYQKASLQLVAGDVQRVAPTRNMQERHVRYMRRQAEASQFQEESFFEYHLYTLDRKTTIKNNQTKQISLLNTSGVPIQKRFIFNGQNQFYRNPIPNMPKQKVGVFLEFENKTKNNLGMPLPKGIVRVYKKDRNGGLQFIGEDRIDHTPKDEKITVKMGEAFDIVAQRKQTDFKKRSDKIFEMAFEIEIRNHKKENISVEITEPIGGDWEILDASHPHDKTKAFELKFDIAVSKNGSETLSYRVRVRH